LVWRAGSTLNASETDRFETEINRLLLVLAVVEVPSRGGWLAGSVQLHVETA